MTQATAVKERPILFSGPMIRAILDEQKTQTRRLNGLNAINAVSGQIVKAYQVGPWWRFEDEPVPVHGTTNFIGKMWTLKCPYGQPGDRLWVRETWAKDVPGCPNGLSYKADHLDPDGDGPANPMTWKPSIHMPRAASRITLEVTGVRVERLQDISEEDAIAEGVERTIATRERFGCRAEGLLLYRDYEDKRDPWQRGYECPIQSYRTLWDSINADKHPWESNPFVWVVEFKRV